MKNNSPTLGTIFGSAMVLGGLIVAASFLAGCEHDGITKRSCDPTYSTMYNKDDCNEYLKRNGQYYMIKENGR